MAFELVTTQTRRLPSGTPYSEKSESKQAFEYLSNPVCGFRPTCSTVFTSPTKMSGDSKGSNSEDGPHLQAQLATGQTQTTSRAARARLPMPPITSILMELENIRSLSEGRGCRSRLPPPGRSGTRSAARRIHRSRCRASERLFQQLDCWEVVRAHIVRRAGICDLLGCGRRSNDGAFGGDVHRWGPHPVARRDRADPTGCGHGQETYRQEGPSLGAHGLPLHRAHATMALSAPRTPPEPPMALLRRRQAVRE